MHLGKTYGAGDSQAFQKLAGHRRDHAEEKLHWADHHYGPRISCAGQRTHRSSDVKAARTVRSPGHGEALPKIQQRQHLAPALAKEPMHIAHASQLIRVWAAPCAFPARMRWQR